MPTPRPAIPGVNTMAIAALVFGILLPPIGIVMGHIALNQIRRTGESGRTVAIVALVVGYAILLTCGCGIPLFLTL